MFERKTPGPAPLAMVPTGYGRKSPLLAFACCLAAATALSASAQTSARQDPAERERPDGGTLVAPFDTRHAHFEPVAFDQVPGWREDSLRESLKALRQSCHALAGKPSWSDLCAQAAMLEGADSDAVRTYFERNFSAFNVMTPEGLTDGLVTGYFEPVLDGSRVRTNGFRHPVYGPPRDLLLLDSQSISGRARQWFRMQEGRLLPAAAGESSARSYSVLLSTGQPDIRDKRFRVRIDGDRILPYFSRQEIDQRPLDAPVLAWVADPFALYSVQVQGVGKIRLEDGDVLRVGFAEQNGHAFPARGQASDIAFGLSAIKTRGLGRDRSSADAGRARYSDDELARLIADLDAQPDQTTVRKPKTSARRERAASDAADGRNTEVDRIVALLSAQRSIGPSMPSRKAPTAAGLAVHAPSATGSRDEKVAAIVAALARPEDGKEAGQQAGQTQDSREYLEPAAGDAAAMPVTRSLAMAKTTIPDPSYVFFRGIDDGPQGPVGALGVPLTAGRSLAVDPRTLPLGSPVFIATREPVAGNPLQRLMFAQDTSGAIRGSGRSDLFWGTGETAGRLALATNHTTRMWLLLPRGQQPSSAHADLGQGLTGNVLPDCVVSDPDLCVED